MSQTQQYWLPGYGLSRHVVLSQIQYFLGPSASARPYSYQGREGYLIVGSLLTREQIKDLATKSEEYEREAAMRMSHNAQPYEDSNGKSEEPYINELIPVGYRDRDRDRKRSSSQRRPRHQRSW